MQVKELGHLVLYVADLERSVGFYGDLLGWTMVTPEGLPFPAAAFSSGRTHHELLLIEVGPDAAPVPGGRRLGLYHVGLKVGDSDEELREAHRRLVEAGVPIVGASDHTVTHSLYVLDPDGNEVELYIDVPGVDWHTDPRWSWPPSAPSPSEASTPGLTRGSPRRRGPLPGVSRWYPGSDLPEERACSTGDGATRWTGGPARRAQTAAGRHLRRRADRHGADLRRCDRRLGGDRPLPAGPGVPHPDRSPRPARRPGRQGFRHVVGARRILRLRDRPRRRRTDPGRDRLVPRVGPPGHLVLLPFAVLAVTSLVSYQRAKAESLGISAKGGLMERAERMILLGIGLPVGVLPGARPVGDAGTDVGDRRRTLRQGVAPRRGTAAGRRPAGPPDPDRCAHHVVGQLAYRRPHHLHVGVPVEGAPAGELSSRSGRTWRARQARAGSRQRTGRRHG